MQRERFPNLLVAGKKIGEAGTKSELDNMASHLHFEIRLQEEESDLYYLNPEYYFNKNSNINFNY